MKMEWYEAKLDSHLSSEVSFMTHLPVSYKGTVTQLLGHNSPLFSCHSVISPWNVNRHCLRV